MNYYLENVIYKKLNEIAFLNLWDECFIIAIEMNVGRVEFEEVKLNYSLIEGKDILTEGESKEFWMPMQNKVFELVCNSIEEGEMDALYIGRYLNGSIKGEDTFVHRDELDKWMESRGLERGEPSFRFEDESVKLFSDMEKSVLSYAYEHAKIVYVPQEVNEKDWSIEELEFENRQLKASNELMSSILDDFHKTSQARTLNNTKIFEKQNRHKERYAVNREQILGAAMSVIANYSAQSRNSNGKVEATKVRTLIEDKSPLFWESQSEPPMKTEGIERLIREWLKKSGV
jgi:hypothetical protein